MEYLAFKGKYDLILENGLTDTLAYLCNLIICGSTQEEHDQNLAKFNLIKTHK